MTAPSSALYNPPAITSPSVWAGTQEVLETTYVYAGRIISPIFNVISSLVIKIKDLVAPLFSAGIDYAIANPSHIQAGIIISLSAIAVYKLFEYCFSSTAAPPLDESVYVGVPSDRELLLDQSNRVISELREEKAKLQQEYDEMKNLFLATNNELKEVLRRSSQAPSTPGHSSPQGPSI